MHKSQASTVARVSRMSKRRAQSMAGKETHTDSALYSSAALFTKH